MAAVGYKYESSDDAERSQDKTTAIADYRCRRSEQYEEVRVELGKVLTAQWLERHPEAVKDLEAKLETLVSDAKRARMKFELLISDDAELAQHENVRKVHVSCDTFRPLTGFYEYERLTHLQRCKHDL